MKQTFLLAVLLLATASAMADTNTIAAPLVTLTNSVAAPLVTLTNSVADTNKLYGKYDLTLGGDGFTTTGQDSKSGFEVDVSLSSNPFKSAPALWVGIDQGIGWEPGFAGSTDAVGYWAMDIYKGIVYFNPGWSGGVAYGGSPASWRTGPLIEFQYYVTDSVFIYSDVNYDAVTTGGGKHGLRESFGFGFEF